MPHICRRYVEAPERRDWEQPRACRPHPKHLVSPAPPWPPPLCWAPAPDTREGDPGPFRAPVLLAWALPQGAPGGRAGEHDSDGGSDAPQPPSAVSPHGVAPVRPFSLNLSKPGFQPRCVQLLAKRPSPQPVPATRTARTRAREPPSFKWARPAGAPTRLEGRSRRQWRGGGGAAERAPGRCAREQPRRARPGSGTGCPPRKAEAHPTDKAGTYRPSQTGCPPALQAAPVSLPVPPDGFQGSVVRLSLGEPRSLQDGAASASGARVCEATSARAEPGGAKAIRRKPGDRGC